MELWNGGDLPLVGEDRTEEKQSEPEVWIVSFNEFRHNESNILIHSCQGPVHPKQHPSYSHLFLLCLPPGLAQPQTYTLCKYCKWFLCGLFYIYSIFGLKNTVIILISICTHTTKLDFLLWNLYSFPFYLSSNICWK